MTRHARSAEGEVRWLDDDEQHAWRSYLTASRLVAERIERQLQQSSQLPHAYYEILVRLSEAPRRTLRMSELANTATSSRSRLSHAVARLEEAGWVHRHPCPDDRRGAFAVLTDAGMDTLAAAAPAHVTQVRACLLDALTPEQVRALAAIGDAVIDHLGEPPAWPIGGADAPGADPTVTGSTRAAPTRSAASLASEDQRAPSR